MSKVKDYIFQKKTSEQLAHIVKLIKHLTEEVYKMSVELDDLITEVEETEGVEQSVITLLQGIVGELNTIIAEYEAEKIDVAKLVELKDGLKTNTDALAAAAATVPPAPVP